MAASEDTPGGGSDDDNVGDDAPGPDAEDPGGIVAQFRVPRTATP